MSFGGGSVETKTVPKEKLFQWHSALKLVVMFPGMQSKIGKENYHELSKAVLDLESTIGIVKGEQGFNGN